MPFRQIKNIMPTKQPNILLLQKPTKMSTM